MEKTIENLKAIEKWIDPLIEHCKCSSWREALSIVFLQLQRLGIITSLKILREMGFLTEAQNVSFEPIICMEGEDYDSIEELSMQLEEIVFSVYQECGWEVESVPIRDIVDDFFYDYIGFSNDIEYDIISEFFSDKEDAEDIWDKDVIPFLKERNYFDTLSFYMEEVKYAFFHMINFEYDYFQFNIFNSEKVANYLKEIEEIKVKNEITSYISYLLDEIVDPMMLRYGRMENIGLDEQNHTYTFNTVYAYLESFDGEEVHGHVYKTYSIVYVVLLHYALELYEKEKEGINNEKLIS